MATVINDLILMNQMLTAEGALGTGSSQRMETAAVCVAHLFRCVGCAELRANILYTLDFQSLLG